jgi:hypothetical protein
LVCSDNDKGIFAYGHQNEACKLLNSIRDLDKVLIRTLFSSQKQTEMTSLVHSRE